MAKAERMAAMVSRDVWPCKLRRRLGRSLVNRYSQSRRCLLDVNCKQHSVVSINLGRCGVMGSMASIRHTSLGLGILGHDLVLGISTSTLHLRAWMEKPGGKRDCGEATAVIHAGKPQGRSRSLAAEMHLPAGRISQN